MTERKPEPVDPGSQDDSSLSPEVPENLRRILESPTHRRADQDLEFLAGDELRGVRLELEFLKPDLALADLGIRNTVVVFGSTRVVEPRAARRALARARARVARDPDDPDLARELAVAERLLARSHYYQIARELGRLVARADHGTADGHLVLMTGGGPGLMEAANRGAYETGASTIGLNITLPREQLPNPYLSPHLSFQFRYFALRKMHFMLRARALVAFPGGYGTFDELFETLCLIQTEKRERLPVILVGKEYWQRAVDFDFLAAEGMIDPEDLRLFEYAESAEEIWNVICRWYDEAGLSLFG
jgi:uncharacterized protein (TIGR00730 family)